MKIKFYLTIGISLILGGFLMDPKIFTQLLKHDNTSITQVYADAGSNSKVSDKNFVTGPPSNIEVPEVGISLPVRAGQYDASAQTWTLSDDSAYFAASSFPPNNKGGNTLIYGHDIIQVFEKLNGIKPGQKAIVRTSNGHVFTYVFVESHDIAPEDTSIFSYKGKPVLTLQTCSGLFSQHRRMFVFSLVEFK